MATIVNSIRVTVFINKSHQKKVMISKAQQKTVTITREIKNKVFI